MGKNERSIVIKADIMTELKNMDKVVSEFNSKLGQGATKIDLTKGVGKELTKLTSKFQDSFSKIGSLIPNNILKIEDSGEFEKTSQNIIKTFKDIQRIASDMSNKGLIDAKKLFPEAFDERVSNLHAQLSAIGTSFAKIAQKEAELVKANNQVSTLTSRLKELGEAAANLETLEINIKQTSQAFEQAKTSLEDFRGSLSHEIQAKIDSTDLEAAKKEADELTANLEALKKKGITTGKSGKAVFNGKGIKEWTPGKDASEEEKKRAESISKMLQDYNSINTSLRKQKKLIEDIEALKKIHNEDSGLTESKNLKAAAVALGKGDDARRILSDVKKAESDQAKAQVDLSNAQNASKEIEEITKKLDLENKRVEELVASIKALKAIGDFSQVKEKFKELTGIEISQDMLASKEGVEELKKSLESLDISAYKELQQELKKLGIVLPQTGDGFQNFRTAIDGAEKEMDDFLSHEQEIKNLRNQLLQFFSISNSIDLFKRAVNSAMETVKELDATMTEAAVVTDYSVGDMWDKLPQYTDQAQKLGIAINDMYGATTLYYQQGLKNNEAMALGVETMKMAKIAGMDSADATTAMTAALRGFNMELNETSATRVNDVYSQLAAVTAADTNQIATAMSKTASIAASANMEFETTAAFLAQIIETTQEAPETAGTALKTIIARFSEVKSLQSQGLSTGRDSEGEELDVNKIQTALRSVGISMDGFFAGTEGLDDVLLRLAEKWDTLDFTTQRYIATTAAGSRQQSRFIAMMSDYKRTTELVGEANNSAGASQEQFNKTLDSMESKLQKLENAWKQFIMGLANNEILKFGVDTLTTIVTGLNKVIDAISGNNGLIKSITSLGAVIGGLKLGKTILGDTGAGSLLDSLKGFGNKATKPGQEAGQQAGEGFIAGFKRASNSRGAKETFKNFFLKDTPRERFKKNLLETNRGAYGWNTSAANVRKVLNTYDTSGAEAAIKQYEDLAKVQLKVEERQKLLSNQLKISDLDFKAMGQSVMGVGSTLGLLSGLFSSLGLEEASNTVAEISKYVTLLGAGLNYIPGALNKIKTMDPQKLLTSIKTAGLVAAAALVVAGVVSIAKAWKDAKNANDKAISSMSKAANEFADQVKEAKEELNQLEDKHKELDNLQKSLKDLTKGTTQWKQKLIEVNTTVLDLIDKYPELIGYVSRGAEGQLVIDDAGWDAAAKGAEQRYQTAAIGQMNANLRKTEYQEQKALEEAQSDAVQKKYQKEEFYSSKEAKDGTQKIGAGLGIAGGLAGSAAIGAAIGSAVPIVGTILGAAVGGLIGWGIGALVGEVHDDISGTEDQITYETTGLSKDDYMAFAAAASEKGLTNAAGTSKTEFKELFNEMGLQGNFETLYSNIQSLGTEFDELGVQALSLETAQKSYVDSIVSQVADFNATTANSKYREQAESVVSNNNENLGEQINKEAERLALSRNYVDKNGEATDTLIKEYAEVNNMNTDEVRAKIADSSLSVETMLTAVAGKNVDNQLADQLEKMTKIIEKVGKKSESLIRALSKEGYDITRGDLKAFRDVAGENFNSSDEETQKNVVEEYLKKQGLGQGQISEIINSDAWRTIWENFHLGAEAFADVADQLKSMGLDESAVDDRVSKGAAQGLVNAIKKQVTQGSTGSADMLSTILEMSNNLDQEGAQKFAELLGPVEWDSISDIESLDEALIELFGDSKTSAQAINHLQEAMIKFANASGEVSKQVFRENSAKREELIKELLLGNKNSFTEEELSLFTADQQKNFKWTPSGYIYTGPGGANALVGDLRKQSGVEAGVVNRQQAIDWINKNQGVSVGSNILIGDRTLGKDFVKGVLETGDKATVDWAEGFLGSLNWKDENSSTVKKLVHLYTALNSGGVNSEGKPVDNEGKIVEMLKTEDVQRYFSALDDNSKIAMLTLANRLVDYDRNSGYTKIYSTNFNQAIPEELRGGSGVFFQEAIESSIGQEYSIVDLFGAIQSGSLKIGDEGLNAGEEYVSEDKIRELYSHYTGNDGELKEIDDIVKFFNTELIPALTRETDLYDYYIAQSNEETYQATREADSVEERNTARSALGAKVLASGLESTVKSWKTQFLTVPTEMLQLLALQAQDSSLYLNHLGETIKNNEEAFVIGQKAGVAYYKALSNISAAAKNVFGVDMTNEFIEQNKNLFLQMIQGGEEAEKAILQLGEAITTSILGLGSEAASTLTNLFAGKEGTFNAEQIIATLSNFGYSEELIKQIFQAYGYDLVVDQGHTIATKVDAGFIFDSLGETKDLGEPYDRFYNQLQLINEELRRREELEREYQNLLRKEDGTSGREVLNNLNDRRNTLMAQKKYWEEIKAGRLEDLINFSASNKYNGYAQWNASLGTVVINRDALEELRLSGSEKYGEVVEYIGELETMEGEFDEATDALWDIDDQLYEINQQGKEEYLDLENRIKDALISARQEEINKLSEINNSINSTNDKILSSINQAINERRQNRENQKNEQELGDKRERLAYLQMDTSGANQLEILSLQKEIAEQEQSYTDSLIDQKINELQEQNDKASEQRQQQIDILQAQLEFDKENGILWSDVSNLMNTGINAVTGEIISGSELEVLLKKQENWGGMSEIEQKDWLDSLQTDVANAWAWLNGDKETGQESAYIAGLDGALATATQNLLSGLKEILKPEGEVGNRISPTNWNKDLSEFYKKEEALASLDNWYNTWNAEIEEKAKVNSDYAARYYDQDKQLLDNMYNLYRRGIEQDFEKDGFSFYTLYQNLKVKGRFTSYQDAESALKSWYEENYNSLMEEYEATPYQERDTEVWQNDWSRRLKEVEQAKVVWHNQLVDFKRYHPNFNTGGLASFTGPAWLDGTKSRPEYILNASQTQAFLSLVDVLEHFGKGFSKTSTENFGDNIIDIDINIETVKEEADIDMLVEKMQQSIVSGARYRNNTFVQR